MAYRTRSARRLAKKGKRNLIVTILIIAIVLYATLSWILPTFVNAVGVITGIFKSPTQTYSSAADNPTLAPPVLVIPYEATNSSQINISGYATTDAKVKIYVDDELKQTVTVGENSQFEAKNITLGLGTNNIYGKTVDEEKRESLPSKTIRVIYDNEKPDLQVSEPEDGKQVQGERNIKVSGKTEPQATLYINDSRIILGEEGKFSSQQSLKDGENIFIIKAHDQAGNMTEITRRVTFSP